MMDGYRKGWAIRYLREARAEFAAAKKMPYMAASLIPEAVRKAQIAIYYSLGDPAFVEAIVKQSADGEQPMADPILKCLIEIDKMVQQIMQTPEANEEDRFKEVDELIQIASDIVELFTGEKI